MLCGLNEKILGDGLVRRLQGNLINDIRYFLQKDFIHALYNNFFFYKVNSIFSKCKEGKEDFEINNFLKNYSKELPMFKIYS